MSKFDLEEELLELENNYPKMLIAGLRYHISKNDLKIKSKKELEKIVNDYKEIGL